MAERYHYDNDVFISDHFRSDCQGKEQKQSFSFVGAKHQNGKSERAIQTIIYWDRNMMTNAALHWTADDADIVMLW